MATRVPIRGETLAWARATLHVHQEALARAAGIDVDQYQRFESGDANPTVLQLRNIAHRLDRPLAFFLAPVPAHDDVPQTVDFRGAIADQIPASLFREMKRADQQRQAFLDLVGAPDDHVRPREIDWDNVAKRARQFREAMGLGAAFRPAESQAGAVFNFWRAQLEARGYLVFQTTGVAYADFRGLSIYHDILPIILVNGADSANGKIFSLFHEVAHIANHTSGVCLMAEQVQVEGLCNAFAADFLMPRDEVAPVLKSLNRQRWIEALASNFRVSELAAAIRLRRLNVIDDEELTRFRERADEEWLRNRLALQAKDGFAPLWTTRTRDLGPTYLGAVFDALDSDRLNLLDATYLLNARTPIIERMLSDFKKNRPRS
jgi:Zn-dependent peptidase ImmA (M78 family)/transcriptional regulator with XRE-family HTH domain